jgi:hypothetical protein
MVSEGTHAAVARARRGQGRDGHTYGRLKRLDGRELELEREIPLSSRAQLLEQVAA